MDEEDKRPAIATLLVVSSTSVTGQEGEEEEDIDKGVGSICLIGGIEIINNIDVMNLRNTHSRAGKDLCRSLALFLPTESAPQLVVVLGDFPLREEDALLIRELVSS